MGFGKKPGLGTCRGRTRWKLNELRGGMNSKEWDWEIPKANSPHGQGKGGGGEKTQGEVRKRKKE